MFISHTFGWVFLRLGAGGKANGFRKRISLYTTYNYRCTIEFTLSLCCYTYLCILWTVNTIGGGGYGNENMVMGVGREDKFQIFIIRLLKLVSVRQVLTLNPLSHISIPGSTALHSSQGPAVKYVHMYKVLG